MKKIFDFYKKNEHSNRLQLVYQQIPNGKCSNCPKCCYDNVDLSVVEFISILVELGDCVKDYHDKVKDWYLNQYSVVQPCIFLSEGLCDIYHSRPLTCRLFGHQTIDEQNKRIEKVVGDKQKAADWLFKHYHIKVSEQVIGHALSACDFKADSLFTKQDANRLFDQINEISSEYYRANIVDDSLINLTLIEWMLVFFHDEDVLFEQLIANRKA